MNLQKPSIGREELQAVRAVFKTGWLGMGSVVQDFEEKLRQFLNAKYVIAVNSGTSALHLALASVGITSGDEVILPSFTFVATTQAISMCGATPVFCDIIEETLNIDPIEIEKRITARTKAIIPVHFRGTPCDMDRILYLAKKYNIAVVEDAAHAFGSTYKNKIIGSLNDITCFSFDPIKNITCGEGGAICLSDKKLYERIVMKRMLGIDKDAWSRYKHTRAWHYDVYELGFRYHMSNINAAIGIVQLDKYQKMIEHKKTIARRYDRAFAKIPTLITIKTDYDNTALFMYCIRITKNREKFIDFLKERGIPTGIHYLPSHRFSLYNNPVYKLPVTEKIARQIITLPLYHDLTAKNVHHIIKGIKEYFQTYDRQS